MPRQYTRVPLVDRFWPKVLKTDDCWLWQAAKDGAGYGHIGGTGGKTLKAHAVSWEFAYGAVPSGLFVCHHCDVPSCVRPEHLFLGTAKQNTQDMVSKLRGMQGARQWKARLTPALVRLARQTYAEGGHAALRALAPSLSIHPITLHDAATRRTWKHVL